MLSTIRESTNKLPDYRRNFFLRNLISGVRNLFTNKVTLLPSLYLLLLILISIFGTVITPYGYQESIYLAEGGIAQAESPSLAHPLGTTYLGYDVLSRLIVGARPTVVAGLLGGFMIIAIGMTIGVTAGYVGGRIGDLLMRFTDVAYSLPLIPFALVLVGFFGIGFYTSILAIAVILWRGNARVLRSQVLQIKNRQYVLAAKASGASTPHIMIRHIIPNIAPMAFLFFALGIGYTIILQASLAFLGVSDPFLPSWGVMLRNAYQSGFMSLQLGWSLTPGILIALTVVSTFFIGRELESDDEAIAMGGG